MTNQISDAYRAGQVARYHSQPEMNVLRQTNADHTAGMLALLYIIDEFPSADLIKAIVYHDSPELFGGDLSYPFKKAFPDFVAEHDRLSSKLAAEAGIPVVKLSPQDTKWLFLLDRLEASLYCKTHFPHIFKTQPWRDLCEMILELASELLCGRNVHRLGELTILLEVKSRKKIIQDERKTDDAAMRREMVASVLADPEMVNQVIASVFNGAQKITNDENVTIGQRQLLEHMQREDEKARQKQLAVGKRLIDVISDLHIDRSPCGDVTQDLVFKITPSEELIYNGTNDAMRKAVRDFDFGRTVKPIA
tara:strand:+ start:30082 stop:31002 length:921 start_codon:yes stop_codon:yes gene_type:complete